MSIEDLEVLRKKARNIYICGTVITAVVCILMLKEFKDSDAMNLPFVLGLIITMSIGNGPRKEFLRAYKNTFVLKPLYMIFTDLVFNPDMGLDSKIIRETGMMYMGTGYHSNDLISGKYKDINVLLSDVNIWQKAGKSSVTIFKGKWMIFDFNKNFKANIQVCEKGFGSSKLSNPFEKNNYKKIKMEDNDFNKVFKVYAQDETEGFYVLTPHLMQRIKKLNNMISGKLLFCFIDNKLHIGLYNNKDSFEHSLFSKIDENLAIESVSKDIKMITAFVDELNLDNDLFKTQ